MPTKAQIEQQLAETQAELRALQIAKAGIEEGYQKFKDKVREAVRDAKEEHELCDEGVAEFLEELDLKPLTKNYTVPITLTMRTMVKVEGRDDDPVRYLQESLTGDVDFGDVLAEIFAEIDDFGCRYSGVPYIGMADKTYHQLGSISRGPNLQEFSVTFGEAREVD